MLAGRARNRTFGVQAGDSAAGTTLRRSRRAPLSVVGLQDGSCLSAHPSADTYDFNSNECPYRFEADRFWSEPNDEDGAEYGYAVEGAILSSGADRVFVGAPGTDVAGQPPNTDAGKVWMEWLPGGVWLQGITQASVGGMAGGGPDQDERFGSALSWDDDRGLLVGTLGNLLGTGSVEWLEESGGGMMTASSTQPGIAAANVVGWSSLADARLGSTVMWSRWELDPEYPISGYGPGILAGAPGAQVNTGVDAGAVVCHRGNSTWSGLAFDFSDMILVDR